jgi:hypothetical protein
MALARTLSVKEMAQGLRAVASVCAKMVAQLNQVEALVKTQLKAGPSPDYGDIFDAADAAIANIITQFSLIGNDIITAMQDPEMRYRRTWKAYAAGNEDLGGVYISVTGGNTITAKFKEGPDDVTALENFWTGLAASDRIWIIDSSEEDNRDIIVTVSSLGGTDSELVVAETITNTAGDRAFRAVLLDKYY